MKKRTYMTPEVEIYWLFQDIISSSGEDGYETGITEIGEDDIIEETPED